MKVINKMSEVEDKLLDPRELKYRLGNPLRKQINQILSKKVKDETAKKQLSDLISKEDDDKQQLSYNSLSEIHKLLQRLDGSLYQFFFQFLDECKAVAPESKKNPELAERLQRLKQEDSIKQYGSMTASVGSKKSRTIVENARQDIRELKPTLIALLNSLLVVGGTFLFVFKAVEYSTTEPNINVQILVSLIASSIVAIAELYFFAKIL
ncbi:putative transmembrane protein [Halotydeus destructor]|nr:putative transmembrane protein [Halotydeus destructor]